MYEDQTYEAILDRLLHLSRKNQIQGQIRSLQRLLQQLKLIL